MINISPFKAILLLLWFIHWTSAIYYVLLMLVFEVIPKIKSFLKGGKKD